MPHVCPWWIGYLLLSPLRRFSENPKRMFEGYVDKGMVVFDIGCGMGYFSLPLAKMVGDDGKVYGIDLQQKMLNGLARRAKRKGYADCIEPVSSSEKELGLGKLGVKADFATAIHVVHEVPDMMAFMKEVSGALRQGAKVYFREPKGHMSAEGFEKELAAWREAGFSVIEEPAPFTAILIKP